MMNSNELLGACEGASMFGLTLGSILLPREESRSVKISIRQNGNRLDQVQQGDVFANHTTALNSQTRRPRTTSEHSAANLKKHKFEFRRHNQSF